MSKNTPVQESLQLSSPEGSVTNVEKYEFEPIKGYPMLNWRGKRPFTSTQYYPAQLKEVHGEEVDGWRNKIYWGDNLQVMSHLLKEFRGAGSDLQRSLAQSVPDAREAVGNGAGADSGAGRSAEMERTGREVPPHRNAAGRLDGHGRGTGFQQSDH